MVKLFLYWGARVIAALILLQTLFFKFSGSAESIYIFSAVGIEPWGRIGVGVLELIASVMLLISSVSWIGALLSLGLMFGAIGMHLTLLGIEVQGDGGYLFILAVAVVICSLFVLWTDKEKAITFLEHLKK
ncbi:MAG: DoxX family protein [Cyclobacteriaceae bacterium]